MRILYAKAMLTALDLWSWFPFGRAGLRTGMLFISGFLIFILRVAQLHVGIRTTASPVSTIKEYALRYETLQTALWYTFSGWFFAEIFMHSAPTSANVGWTTAGKTNERPRLNERRMYLLSYFIMLALVQTGVHLAHDYDRVDMPAHKTDKHNTSRKPEEAAVEAPTPGKKVLSQMQGVFMRCFTRNLVLSIVAPNIYSIFIRRTAWSYTMMFAKHFLFYNLPKSSALPSIGPFHSKLMLRAFCGGLLLSLMWEIANLVFSTYVAQEPLKNDRPITYESKDPNGSLLTGLNGKKLQTRAFAFWELVLIAERYQGRRKVIFEDIDRKDGSAWKQILAACQNVLEDMNYRVQTRDPMAVMTQPDDSKTEGTPQILSMIQGDGSIAPVEPVQTLPRLTRDIQKENLFSQPPPPKTITDRFGRVTHELADKYGNSQPKQGAEVKRLLDKAKTAVLTPEQEEMITPQGIWAMLAPHLTQFLKGPAGWPFRQEFRRRVAAVVLGKPYGDVGIIVDAADALSRFAVCSLKEDSFGNVQKDVPGIISLMTRSIVGLEGLRATFGMHWTDVSGEKSCEELDEIMGALRSGLKDVVEAFGDYFDDMGVSRGDARRAQEAMVVKEVGNERTMEMKETKKRP